MRPNYVELNENDKIVTIDIEKVTAVVDFSLVMNLYLTPLEALIYSLLRKVAGSDKEGRKFLKIPLNDFLRVFRHFDGRDKTIIENSIAILIAKRLIVEGEDMSQLFETNEAGELYHFYHCL